MSYYQDERESYQRPDGAPPRHHGGYGQQEGYGQQGYGGGGGGYGQQEQYGRQHGGGGYGQQQGGRYEQQEQYGGGGYGQQQGGRHEQQGYGQQQHGGGRYEQQEQYGGGGGGRYDQGGYDQGRRQEQRYDQQDRYEQRPQHHQGGYDQQQGYAQQRPHATSADPGADYTSYAAHHSAGDNRPSVSGLDPRLTGQNYGGGNAAGTIGAASFRPPTNTPAMQKQHFQYSACTGRRRALLIGINYIGQEGELRGCINDVKNLQRFLQTHGYRDEVTILTEETNDPQKLPTKANIEMWMDWLVQGAQKDDALFFHYSGHGTQVKVDNKAEADGLGEAICPLDFKQTGMIVDMDIYNRLVKPLPAGCRLTAIFDACHSGSAMNLPYMYSTKGTIKEPNFALDGGKALLTAGMGYARDGNAATALTSLFGAAKGMFNERQAGELLREQNTSEADVISWSGCKDDQTSADTTEEGMATGAMSYAFVKALTENPKQNYIELLTAVRKAMQEGGYTQKPQLSACHPIDTDIDFIA